MKDSIKNRKKKLLALCLSFLLVSSAGAAFAACGDSDTSDSSSSDSSSSSATSDVQDDSDALISNSKFEVFNSNNGKNVIATSVTGWTRAVNSASSGTALSSKAASGIIDVTADGWKNLTSTNLDSLDDAAKLTEADAIKKWDTLTARDKLKFYEAWEAANKDKTLSSDFEKYEALNISLTDIPDIENPGTHDNAEDNTKVLMIHNEYPAKSDSVTKTTGTAQKWTSSSTVTVAAGTSAKFSVWVKTADLKSASSADQSQKAVGKGAYVRLTQTVGSTTLDAFEVKNIDTESMNDLEDTNGWKQYTFYLKGSSFTDTTFSVVLGLGQGGGTDRLEYVNGYAFFDDIECEIIDNDTFDTATADITNTAHFDDDKTEKTFDAYSTPDQSVFAMDYYPTITSIESTLSDEVLAATTVGKTETDGYTASTAPWLDGFVTEGDVTQVFANTAALNGSGNKYQQAVYDNYFKDTTFTDNDKVLLLLSANGMAYEATSTYEFTFKPDQEYMAVSFFVKTSDMNGVTGAGITLVDGDNKTSFTSIDTTDITAVSVGDNEDLYEGWQQCFFFVKNETGDDEASFTLTFNFGPTSITTDTAKDDFADGFAAFTKFEAYYLSKSEYNSAKSGTYAKLVALTGTTADDEADGDSGFDSAAGSPTNAIKEGLANPQNYKGVYSDSYRVSVPTAADDEETAEQKRAVNNYANAGLLNKEYFIGSGDDGYFDSNTEAWFNAIKALSTETEAEKIWADVFGDATQPLLIYNDSSRRANLAYGYIGSSTTIAADTYTAISVRVKASVGATASVYLVDMDDTDRQTVLSIGGNRIYWYDDDGNICTADPTKKSTQIAFKLDAKTGLYQANKNWSGYSSLTEAQKSGYFANLSAYEKNADGNLVVAENGASHSYNDYTWNGEAFYGKDGKYYADKACKTLVYDLKDVAALSPRYEATAENKDLSYVVTGTDDWQTITFYVHTGDVAKNYRLEVWSGTRDGKTVNADGTYVIFDANNPVDSTNTAESNFTSLTEVYKETEEAYYFESVFSYYDSDSFLRYASELDTEKVGNLYKNNYTPSEQTSGIAYLEYRNVDDGNYLKFADFALSEKTVAAEEVSDSDSSSSDDSSENDSGTNVWMLASSIAVAAVLLIAIISLAVQKIVKRARRKNGIKSRNGNLKKLANKQSKKEEKPSEEDDSPYND